MYSISEPDHPSLGQSLDSIQRSPGETPERSSSAFALKRPAKVAETAAELAEIGEHTVSIAYDMCNPLSVILNGISLCQDVPMTEKARSRLALALEEAERLKRMVADILEFARYREFSDLQWQDIDMSSLLAEVSHLVSQRSAVDERHIVLKPVLPKVWVQGDYNRLKQVFFNLLLHAYEAVPSNETLICEFCCDSTPSNVWIQIHNREIPIPSRRLHQLSQQTAKRHEFNVGLQLIRQIVEAHAGSLVVQISSMSSITIGVNLPISTAEGAHRRSGIL